MNLLSKAGGQPTSLIEELQVAEQELLVDESALPESFLLASNRAEATSILAKVLLKSNPVALYVPKPQVCCYHALNPCLSSCVNFPQAALFRLRPE